MRRFADSDIVENKVTGQTTDCCGVGGGRGDLANPRFNPEKLHGPMGELMRTTELISLVASSAGFDGGRGERRMEGQSPLDTFR